MTLNEIVLQKLANWRPARDSRQTLTLPDEGSGWAVAVTADRHDELGSAVWEMTLQRATAPAARAAGDLEAWAERITGRVSGLLETLQLIEVDTQRDEALLRSDQPSRRGEGLYYYEVLLKGLGQAAVRRYHGRTDDKREQVLFALTHEVLAKLVTDLVAD